MTVRGNRRIAMPVLTVLAVCLLLPVPAGAAAADSTDVRDPVIGLALSGGSAKGLAHVGVLQVLEDVGLVPDVITGTSMGAIIGGLYAAGHDAAAINEIAATLDWDRMFSNAAERRHQAAVQRFLVQPRALTLPLEDRQVGLPEGLINGQHIQAALAKLTHGVQDVSDFRELEIPFAALAADLETGEPVLLNSGNLAYALRASMSIPSLFTPTEVGDRWLVDGGIVRNLPVDEAYALGADIVISVGFSTDLHPRDSLQTFIDVLEQTVNFHIKPDVRRQANRADHHIQVDVDDFSAMDFQQHRALIARGAVAARALEDSLRAVAANRRSPRAPPQRARGPDARYRIAAVEINGANPVLHPLILERLLLGRTTHPRAMDADMLAGAIDRIYGTGLFSSVRYRLERIDGPALADQHTGAAGEPEAHVLHIDVIERRGSTLGFGLRYDTERRAAILLELTSRRLRAAGDAFTVRARLGGSTRLEAIYATPLRFFSPFHTALDVTLQEFPLSSVGETRPQRNAVRSSTAGLYMVRRFGHAAMAGPGVRVEAFRTDDALGVPAGSARRDAFVTLQFPIWVESTDRHAFPRSGQRMQVSTSWTHPGLGAKASFGMALVDWQGYLRLHEALVLRTHVALGTTTGTPPQHYRFLAGGRQERSMVDSRRFAFAGARRYALQGDHLQLGGVALRTEPFPAVFLRVGWEVARLSDAWHWAPTADAFAHALHFTVGHMTPIGPVNVALQAPTSGGGPRLVMGIGYNF